VPADLLEAVANRLNQRLLAALAVEPNHPRRLAGLLGMPEAEVSRRLKALERLGLLDASWQVNGAKVRQYRLRATALRLDIGPAGVNLLPLDGKAAAAVDLADAGLLTPIPPHDGFVGRAQDLAAVAGPDPVVIVEGIPGIGKTALLARAAAGTAGTQAFWMTCRGVETVAWLAARLASHLRARGEAAAARRLEAVHGPAVADAVLAALDAPGSLAVIDDVHRVADPGLRALVADAAARLANGRLRLGSRERVPHAPRPGVRVLELAGLPDADALALLAHDGVGVPAELRERVRDEAGGHPLALHLLAEAAKGGALAPLLDRRPEQELAEFLLAEIDARLGDLERAALAHASLFPHAFGADDLRAVGAKAPEAALDGLRRRRLVAWDEDGYRLHEVVRNFYYARLQDKARLHTLAADHCLARGDATGHLEALHHLQVAGAQDRMLAVLAVDLDTTAYDTIDEGLLHLYGNLLDRLTPAEVGDALWGQVLDERGDLAFHRREWAKALAHYDDAAAAFAATSPDRLADLAAKRARCVQRLGATETVLRQAPPGARAAPTVKA
jgi:hypothetical protein